MVDRPGRDAPPNFDDYDAARASFRIPVPARFNAVLDVLEPRAAADPDALALLSLDAEGEVAARHTFAELAAASRRMAHAWTALGIGKGDPVFVMLPRVPEWYVAVLGAMRLGAVPMPAPNLLTPRDIAYRVERAEAVAAVTDAQGAAKLDAVADRLPSLRWRVVTGPAVGLEADGWEPLQPLLDASSDGPTPADPTAADDPLLLYFTSGTVAYPKMVLHTQASYGLGHQITARYWQDLKPGDVHWTLSDTGWAKAAWGKLFGQWALGATVVQMDMGKPSADLILGAVARHGVTTFCAPPTVYRLLVQSDLRAYDLSSLRHCCAAGEPLNPEVLRAWADGTGLQVHDGYGQTETVNLVANYRSVPIRPGSMGKPTPGFDIGIVDAEGNPVPDGEEGLIGVRVEPERPLGLFAGYHRDPDATAAAFAHGWYLTGDRAVRDADGYLWFVGRDDDVITSSAYRIGPFEVESALIEHPAVVEAAVVGRDDPQRTQVVTAFVTLAAGVEGSDALATELQDHVKAVTAPYKYPREIHFVDELPKTVSGKIRRTELRDRLREDRPD
jgi:acyl-coenzyme A synthetase/AMP-(fatty) acid ligase